MNIYQNILDIAFFMGVINGNHNLVSHFVSFTFSCYSDTISHISYNQNTENHLYITPSNNNVCTLMAKNVV